MKPSIPPDSSDSQQSGSFQLPPILHERWPELANRLQNESPNRRSLMQAIDWQNWWQNKRRNPTPSVSPAAHVLLIGLDDPQQLSVLAQQWGDELTFIHIIEPDIDHLCWLAGQNEMLSWLNHPRLTIRMDYDPAQVVAGLAAYGPSVGVNGMDVWLAPSLETRRHEFETLQYVLKSWILAERQDVQVRYKQRGRPLANVILNSPRMVAAHGLKELKDCFQGIPAFLIGAGPSLNNCRQHLAEAGKRGIILLADTALTPVIEMGVKPDVLVTLDPSPANQAHFAEASVPSETIVAWSPEVYRGVLERISPDHSTVAVLDNESPLASAMGNDAGIEGALPRSLQTGEMTYRLAEYLGCNPIVLVGYDLAIPAGGATHADGTALRRQTQPADAQGRIEVEGVNGITGSFQSAVESETGLDGKQIHIPPIFRLYRERLEELIKNSSAEVIDAGGSGARKKGVQIENLATLLPTMPEREQIKPPLNPISRQEAENRRATLSDWMDRIKAALNQALVHGKEFESTLQMWPQVAEDSAVQPVLEAHQSFQGIWDRLQKQGLYIEVIQPCLLHLIYRQLEVLRTGNTSTKQLSEQLLKKNIDIYREYDSTLKGFLTFVDYAQNALTSSQN